MPTMRTNFPNMLLIKVIACTPRFLGNTNQKQIARALHLTFPTVIRFL